MIEIKKVKKLSKEDRRNFDCENKELNEYIKNKFYERDIKSNTSTFYALFFEKKFVGFYTLAPTSLQRNKIKTETRKPYESIPSYLIGRLAISKQYKGNGLGYKLMLDIFNKIRDLSSVANAVFLTLKAINKDVIKFYEKFGFKRMSNDDDNLVMALNISSLFE